MDSKTPDKPINNTLSNSYTGYLDLYKKTVLSHSFLISILILLYSILCNSLDVIYQWMMSMTLIVMSLYVIMFGVYIHKILNIWSNTSKISLTESCYRFAIQNYKLLREYKEFIEINNISIPDNDKAITSIKDGIMPYANLKDCIIRVLKYLKMIYYLPLVKSDDNIELRHDTFYINITTESITNKRNRKLETILNDIPYEYKLELFSTWSTINKEQSLHIFAMIPCKWIIYEYRNMFRYFYNTHQMKDLYTKFNNEYTQIESIVYDLCNKIHSINSDNNLDIPKPFLNVFNIVTELFIFLINNFVAICILICFNTGNNFLFSLLMITLTHFIIMTLIHMINNLCPQISTSNNDISTNKLDELFNDMNSLMIVGKSTI